MLIFFFLRGYNVSGTLNASDFSKLYSSTIYTGLTIYEYTVVVWLCLLFCVTLWRIYTKTFTLPIALYNVPHFLLQLGLFSLLVQTVLPPRCAVTELGASLCQGNGWYCNMCFHEYHPTCYQIHFLKITLHFIVGYGILKWLYLSGVQYSVQYHCFIIILWWFAHQKYNQKPKQDLALVS